MNDSRLGRLKSGVNCDTGIALVTGTKDDGVPVSPLINPLRAEIQLVDFEIANCLSDLIMLRSSSVISIFNTVKSLGSLYVPLPPVNV